MTSIDTILEKAKVLKNEPDAFLNWCDTIEEIKGVPSLKHNGIPVIQLKGFHWPDQEVIISEKKKNVLGGQAPGAYMNIFQIIAVHGLIFSQ